MDKVIVTDKGALNVRYVKTIDVDTDTKTINIKDNTDNAYQFGPFANDEETAEAYLTLLYEQLELRVIPVYE